MLRLGPQTGAQALHPSQEEEEREEAQEEALWWLPSPPSGVRGKVQEKSPLSWSLRSTFYCCGEAYLRSLARRPRCQWESGNSSAGTGHIAEQGDAPCLVWLTNPDVSGETPPVLLCPVSCHRSGVQVVGGRETSS